MFDVVKKNYFVSLLSNYCFITIIMGIRLVDFRNQFPLMTWQRYRLKVLKSFVGFFFCVFFFVFSSRTDRFFNLSCHLFSYPLSLKQTSSFTKIIFFFFFGFSQKIKRGKKSFVPSLSLCRSRQILGYVCRPIKGSQLTPYVQVRLTCLPSNIHVFLFKQISYLQGVVCEYIPSYYVFFFHYV